MQTQVPMIKGGINPATFNVFCATGEGGGIDPTCGKDGTGSSVGKPKSIAALKKGVKDLIISPKLKRLPKVGEVISFYDGEGGASRNLHQSKVTFANYDSKKPTFEVQTPTGKKLIDVEHVMEITTKTTSGKGKSKLPVAPDIAIEELADKVKEGMSLSREQIDSMSKEDMKKHVDDLFKTLGIKPKHLKGLKGETTGIYTTTTSVKQMKEKLTKQLTDRKGVSTRSRAIEKEYTTDDKKTVGELQTEADAIIKDLEELLSEENTSSRFPPPPPDELPLKMEEITPDSLDKESTPRETLGGKTIDEAIDELFRDSPPDSYLNPETERKWRQQMREELIRATPGKLAEKSEELADKFESNRDQLQKATEKVASKIRTPEQVDSLATRILNAFTGGKSLESQSDLFDNIAAASDIWGKGRKQLIEEYGEVTGKIISGTALAGSLLGGFTGGIAAGTTLGSLWWVFPSFITSSVQGGAMLGAGLTAAPFIALAHSIRGVRNLTRNAKMEVPLNDQQIASVASDWFIQHLRKIAEANQFTANNFFFQH